MKNTNTETTKTTRMIYKKTVPTTTGRVDIEVNLADDCRNGHAHFSITGTIWERRKNGRMIDIAGGCIHEEILEVWPEAAPFVALHLSDSNGAPTYAVENGFYDMRDESKTPAERRIIAGEHFRTTPENLAKLFTAEDEDQLRFMLENLGIVEKWRDEARAAITKLEELTGQKWDHDYTWPRAQYKPLTDAEKASLEKRLAEGYYTPEAREARKEADRLDKIERKRAAILENRQKIVDKAHKQAAVELWLLEKTEEIKKTNPNFLFDMDMAIFYSHSNTVAFNWRGYGPRFTKENFAILVESITHEDRTAMECEIKFELK